MLNDYIDEMLNADSVSDYESAIERLINCLYWLTFFIADQSDSQTQFQYIRFIISGN